MYKFINGDSLTVLRTMESESVNCVVTSPPYYGLRDYGVDGQIGLEETPEEYIQRLVDVFHEVKRVLKKDGTLWLNIGDSYAGSGKGAAMYPENAQKYMQRTNKGSVGQAAICSVKTVRGAVKPKDLIGIPWMLAFALRADGWYLRNDIIWAKPNPMPESVIDRCTKSHEYIFMLSKSDKYYYDHKAIQEQANPKYIERYNYEFNTGAKESLGGGRPNGASNTKGMKQLHYKNLQDKGQTTNTMHERSAEGLPDKQYIVRNKRDVWTVPVHPVREAHFATFPKKLIEPCILAGCPKGGVVLDLFAGSGTTAIVAEMNDRNSIGIELNPEYIKIAESRVRGEAGYKQMTMLDTMEAEDYSE